MFSWSAITAAQSKSAEAEAVSCLRTSRAALLPNMTETAATEESDATDLNAVVGRGDKIFLKKGKHKDGNWLGDYKGMLVRFCLSPGGRVVVKETKGHLGSWHTTPYDGMQ